MEIYHLKDNIKVFCVRAKSFPDGIMQAHDTLYSLVTFSSQRRHFGISQPVNGVIVYIAAAEELHGGEAEKFGCETFVVKSGNYISRLIKDYANNIRQVNATFQKFIARPDIDPKGCCVEWYLNEKDVRCMVRLTK
ncbi:MAG: transcriptional regulator [Bacteroidota bacterium]|nr:transcriptional regulator [Bacteroidota bacterium]